MTEVSSSKINLVFSWKGPVRAGHIPHQPSLGIHAIDIYFAKTIATITIPSKITSNTKFTFITFKVIDGKPVPKESDIVRCALEQIASIKLKANYFVWGRSDKGAFKFENEGAARVIAIVNKQNIEFEAPKLTADATYCLEIEAQNNLTLKAVLKPYIKSDDKKSDGDDQKKKAGSLSDEEEMHDQITKKFKNNLLNSGQSKSSLPTEEELYMDVFRKFGVDLRKVQPGA